MKLREIAEIYKELGLGTQAERDEFLRWSSEESSGREMTFIVDSPNSDLKEGKVDGQLA